MMKPHRQIRSSKRVGSESGVACGSEQPSKRFYAEALEQVVSILNSLPISERKTLLAEAYKRLKDN